MPWTWDPQKERSNLNKQGVDFSTAQRVFGDPAHAARADGETSEERWQPIGMPDGAGLVVLVVVRADVRRSESDGDDGNEGRIISARKATSYEREAYEEGEF